MTTPAGAQLVIPLPGDGRSAGPETAWRAAVVETVERYATAAVPADLPVGPATAMPYPIDPDSLPRHSERELADHPDDLTRLGRDTAVRWATGVDLSEWSPVQVPAVLVYRQLPPTPGERFWRPSSTGIAAGSTRTDALFSAICDVLKRDMLAVTWLQRLALPRLDPGALTPEARRRVWWNDPQVHLFDATSEVGVPIVCSLRADRAAGYLVYAATGPDLGTAAERALSGATATGRPVRQEELDFLLRPARRTPTGRYVDPGDQPLTGPDRLDNLVHRCVRAGHRVYAFDLTTPELREIGLHLIRAVIPSLQPMVPGPPGRYLGHPRLYRLPALLGYPVHDEPALNHRPHPFA